MWWRRQGSRECLAAPPRIELCMSRPKNKECLAAPPRTDEEAEMQGALNIATEDGKGEVPGRAT